MAIELAQDLAIEVGAWGPLRCEDFVLPPRRRKSKGTVKFVEVVEVLQGKDCSGKFQLQTTTINDMGHGFSPRRCPDDHREGERNPRQYESASSSSLGTPSSTHFLDRRLSQKVPGYIHHLQHLWRDNLLRLPEGQPYKVRTWYLHHVHQRVWKVPREVTLSMQPEGWHDALLTEWRDQLHNDAVLNIAVVFPEIRALRGTSPAHADLILTQGDAEQAGGITTVFPPLAGAPDSYTWATSLPRHVSGLSILSAASADAILQSHACDLFHGGANIPISNVPTHWMQNGHSFVAVFQDLQGARAIGNPDSASSSHIDVSIEESATQLSPESREGEDPYESAEESSLIEGSSFDEEDLKGLHVFGLMQPMRHCFVRWTTYTNILLDVLREVGLHRDLAIGCTSSFD